MGKRRWARRRAAASPRRRSSISRDSRVSTSPRSRRSWPTSIEGDIVMITRRPAEERGHARFDWLDSRHSFSFGHYYDDAHMGFGPLRVINEAVVAPGTGFDTHPHRDMEILTYLLAGALEHKDSIGTAAVIRPGAAQPMTARTRIRHS